MALDFGLDALEQTTGITGGGSLGALGLGDFSTPDIVPPPASPDPSPANMDFASLGDTGANALGATFSGGGDSGLSDIAAGGVLPDLGGGGGGAFDTAFGGGGGGIGSDYASSGGSPASLSPLSETQDLSAQSTMAPSDTTPDEQKKKEGLSPLAKAGIMAAPALGVLGYQASKGPYKPPAMAPLTQTGIQQGALSAQLLSMYNNGQIQPSQAAKISADYLRNVSQINQYYARAGQGDSTQKIGALNKAKTDMTAQYAAFLDSELKGAMAASGQAGQFFAQAAQIQLAADQAFNNAIASVTTGIGNMAARYLFPQTTTTTVRQS